LSALPAFAPMPTDEALVTEVIARLAREHGIVLTPEDPLITAVLLNKAILQQYLHDTVQPLRQAFAGAVRQARQELTEHTQAQIAYVDEVMLKDRKKFMQAQKAALEELGEQLKIRESWLTDLMAEILKKGRAQLTAEVEQAAMKASATRKKQERKMLGAMFLGMAGTLVGVILGTWVGMSIIGGQ
jgi:hypothetical protein